jgi:hypothetical protein
MVERVKLPLAVSTTPRDANNTSKDALLQNLYIDKSKSGITYVVKRPGFSIETEGITTGLNRGIFINPNTEFNYTPEYPLVWYIDNAGNLSFFIGGASMWSDAETYNLNDVVAYDDGTGPKIYYAKVDNITGTFTTPSSTTTPGTLLWGDVEEVPFVYDNVTDATNAALAWINSFSPSPPGYSMSASYSTFPTYVEANQTYTLTFFPFTQQRPPVYSKFYY